MCRQSRPPTEDAATELTEVGIRSIRPNVCLHMGAKIPIIDMTGATNIAHISFVSQVYGAVVHSQLLLLLERHGA